ncbi:hypothetical protein ACHQM5_016294 [Ranunculus cassubicifolius]
MGALFLLTTYLFFLPRLSFGYYDLSAHKTDIDLLEFPLNLEYLEAEFFLWGALGYGLDKLEPKLPSGGPPPIGVTKANLDPFIRDVMLQFGYQEIGHLKAIKNAVPGFPRPLLDLSAGSFAKVMDEAMGHTLIPPFNPYASGLNFLLASYLIPYVGLTGYVGASPKLVNYHSKRLVAGLLSVESAQDAIIRALLYERAALKVQPYGITVAEFTEKISTLRNRLGHTGVVDEGIVIPSAKHWTGNVVAGDANSVAYDRTPQQILRIVYGNGDEHVPGGFYPKGASGHIAKTYLRTM